MSENLLVRRQKMVQELRRKEIETYMRNIRQRLVVESQLTYNDTPLTEEELEGLKQAMEDQAYSTPSVEIFLLKLKQYSSESLCTRRLFTIFEVAAMHVLQWGKNEGSSKMVHNLSK